MSIYETYTLILTAVAWFVSLIIQLIILSRQNISQRKITELQNRLGARREIASIQLEKLSLMAKWLEEGLEIRSDVIKIEISYHSNIICLSYVYHMPMPIKCMSCHVM